ncbi:MAG: protein arginine kinase [Planctomycetota bacterium]
MPHYKRDRAGCGLVATGRGTTADRGGGVELGSFIGKDGGEWLRGDGPESDIVISSRIRLARNLAQFPFPPRASKTARAEAGAYLKEKLSDLDVAPTLTFFDVAGLEEIDRQFLVERQLISRELSDGDGSRGVCLSRAENVSLMVNEEDHLRIQVLHSGFDLEDTWRRVDALDDAIEEEVTYAFDDQFGYLTSCPTNCGTGIRVSVMLHLPALVLTKEIQKVFQALQKISLAVRGLYGEGSQAMGDFYQISNQTTLGKSEDEIIANLREVVPNIIGYERRYRDALVKRDRQQLHDQVARAHGILRNAQTISSEETMHLLSSLRMGINTGLIDDVEMQTVNELFIQTQPAHLQKLREEELPSSERNVARAAYLRSRLQLDED